MSAIDDFHPLIREWFLGRYPKPTDAQEKAWPLVRQGRHVLVSAPTGSGKTLTAFLTALDRFARGQWPVGVISVLYISPLKALNNDIRQNLLLPLEELAALADQKGQPFPRLRVAVRSGDTADDERRRMLRNPPEIFITTPESLNLMLSSPTTRRVFSDLKLVVLDEIHAVAGSKRGVHLITAVDRLTLEAGEFQRLGLSATVKPLNAAAQWMAGPARSVQIVQAEDRRELDLTIRAVDFEVIGEREIWWDSLVKELKSIIDSHRSTLIFTNSRRMTEKISRLLNDGETEILAWSHHGSMSRELRLSVEARLKEGSLKALVATNSLELGIDIGSLDRVVLIQTPFSVGSTLQRIGRAGHQVGQTSRADFFPIHPRDLLYGAVCADLARRGEIEPLQPPQAPLDVLSQIILSMTIRSPWKADELYAFLTTTSPYKHLARRYFELTLEMLAGRYEGSLVRSLRPRLNYDKIAGTIEAREGAAFLLYQAGGTIPDQGYYRMRLADSKALVGELDEEFVHERRIGDQFAFGTQNWRILKITSQDVEVGPADPSRAMIPFWRAEEVNHPYFLAKQVAEALEDWERRLSTPRFAEDLALERGLEPKAARLLVDFLNRVRSFLGCPWPHRHHIVIEEVRESQGRETHRPVVVHTFWGGRVNRPWAMAVEAAFETRFASPLSWYADNACVLFLLPVEQTDTGVLFELVTPENLEELLRKKLPSTGAFGARFREAAGRALLLPKGDAKRRVPFWLTRQRSKDLLESVGGYADFPMILEAWRDCLETDFDLPVVKELLDELATGRTALSKVILHHPSPLADGVVWKQANELIYTGDTPGSTAQVSGDLLKELLEQSGLRPKISAKVLRDWEDRLLGLAEGWAPESPQEALNRLTDMGWIEAEIWEAWMTRMPPGSVPAENKVVRFRLPGAAVDLVARPSEERDLRGFLERGENEAVLERWLAFRGPIEDRSVGRVFGWESQTLIQTIQSLEEDQSVLTGHLVEGSPARLVCDARNYERLLRRQRQTRRENPPPRQVEELPLFLARWQGLTQPGSSVEDLQKALDRLFGLALPAALWEEAVLPARLSPFHPAWMDHLFHSFGLLWFGAGERRAGLCFREDLNWYLSPPLEETRLLFPSGQPSGLLDLTAGTGQTAGSLTRRLWDLAWKSQIACDSFETLRRGITSGFEPELPAKPSSRGGFRRWAQSRPTVGSWIASKADPAAVDALEREEDLKERARQILGRYGIVFREMLQNELPGFRWRDLLRTFQTLEWSGEITAGVFFVGIAGLQFASDEALSAWRDQGPSDGLWWINAQDPASFCGLGVSGLSEDLPRRVGANWLIYRGSRVITVLLRSGAEAQIRLEPEAPGLDEALACYRRLLEREAATQGSILVETINGAPASSSPYAPAFLRLGFQKDYKGLRLWQIQP